MRFKLFYCPIVVCLFGVLVAGCLDFSAVDADGRACEQITGSDIDAVSPIVKEIRLADPSRGARNFWLEIVFSEPMDFELSNWAQDHFALFEEGEYSSGLVADFAHPPLKANLRGKKVQGEWLPGERGTTFKFVPIKLDDFTTYYLLLSKNLRDLAGNPLAGNLISSYVENDNRKNLSNPFCQKADFVYKLKLQDVSSPMVWLSNQETVEVASNLQTGIPFYFSEPVFGDLQKEVKLFCNGQELPFYIKENRSEQGSDTGLLSAEIFPGQQLFTQENCLLVFNGAIMDEAGWPVRRRGDKPENVDLGQARLPFMVGQEDTIEPVVKEVSSVYEQRYVHFILETSENLSRILFQYRVYKRGSRWIEKNIYRDQMVEKIQAEGIKTEIKIEEIKPNFIYQYELVVFDLCGLPSLRKMGKFDSFGSRLVVNEILFAPLEEQFEFIELFNYGYSDIDMSGWIIQDSGSSNFSFSLESDVNNKILLNGRGYGLVVSKNDRDRAIQAIPPGVPVWVAGEKVLLNRGLKNDGEIIKLWSGEKKELKGSYHNWSAQISKGLSREMIFPSAGDRACNWSASKVKGGTPGESNSVIGSGGCQGAGYAPEKGRF